MMRNIMDHICDSLILVMFILIIIASSLFGYSVYSDRETPDETMFLYKSWCKVNSRTDISIQEWQAMRRARLLPGQQEVESYPVMTPIIINGS